MALPRFSHADQHDAQDLVTALSGVRTDPRTGLG